MTDQFLAEIRILPYNFAPMGWAKCDGQLMPISQNTALFSLLGTYYGGDGKTTFGLPNLQGSVPVSQGTLSGGSEYYLGETGGTDTVTLIRDEMPSHQHSFTVSGRPATARQPPNLYLAAGTGVGMYAPATGPTIAMSDRMLALDGGDLPHNNMQPYLCVQYCIALQGIYPPRD